MHTWLRVTQSPEYAGQENLPSTCGGTGSDLSGAQSKNSHLKTRISKLFKFIGMRGVLEQPGHEENSCEDILKVRTK